MYQSVDTSLSDFSSHNSVILISSSLNLASLVECGLLVGPHLKCTAMLTAIIPIKVMVASLG